MKHVTLAALTLPLVLAGAAALSTPAAAQIVNGTNDTNRPLPEAPIGTKAGGSPSSMQAPGEGPAAAGAIRNNAEAQNGQPLPSDKRVVVRRPKTANNSGY